ncbi:MAG: hypothetical protein AAFU03_16500, partial [Bacteroidota bacterium]
VEGDNNKVKIWLAFEQRPKVLVVANQKGKQLNCTIQEEGDKLVFIFPKNQSRSIVIYGGASKRSRMIWLANYKL